MAVTIDLPFQNQIQQGSGPVSEGFRLTEISYGSNVSQISFDGPDAETSREEVWKINWAFIEYATPEEVLAGKVNQLEELRNFYRQAQMVHVRWKPFEMPQARIWRIVKNTLKVDNIAGSIFNASLNLEYLYDE